MKLKRTDRRNGGFRTHRDATDYSANEGLSGRGWNFPYGSASHILILEEEKRSKLEEENLHAFWAECGHYGEVGGGLSELIPLPTKFGAVRFDHRRQMSN